jgi:recombination associated protein RdgC
MWFKQIQLFQLSTTSYAIPKLLENLKALDFTPCLPSFPSSLGWVSPLGEDAAPLLHATNAYIMLCLQIEEKILPATVIRQAINDKVKSIENSEGRKVYQKEKLSIKDEVTLTLLPRAFSRFTQIYAYIDTRNHWLVLNTTNAAKTEQFLSIFKKSVDSAIKPLEFEKLSPELTNWLKTQNYPNSFSIEKSCVLQDPEQQNRIIRCQQQDLFAASIQALIKDGCEVKQVGMAWHDRIKFVLAENFQIRNLQYEDELLNQAKDAGAETRQQQFDADFYLMSETLTHLLQDLTVLFKRQALVQETNQTAQAVPA